MSRSMIIAGVVFLTISTTFAGEPSSPREALQAFNDYIGGWKGSGTSERNSSDIWKETGSWSGSGGAMPVRARRRRARSIIYSR